MKSFLQTKFHLASLLLFLSFFAASCFHSSRSQDVGEGGRKDPTLPTITGDISDQVVQKGQPAQFDCRASGVPKPAVTWLKDNELLPNTQDQGYFITAGTIFFLAVEISHVGVYQCQATNSVGTVRGRNASLQIATLRSDFRPGPDSTVVIEGNDVVLECIPPRGNPPPTVGWEKDNEPIEENERVQILEDHNLMISSVRLEDEGSYVCTAKNSAVTDPVRSAPANLTVTDAPPFLVVPEDIIAEPGETVLFNCQVTGDPPPELSWNKQNGDLPIGRHEIREDGSLEIRNVQLEDAGNYHCVVKKDHAVYQQAATLRIGDDQAFSVLPRDQTVSVNEEVAFHCEAGGTPAPSVTWQNEETALSLTAGETRGRFRVDPQGTLHILEVQEEDAGTFVCSADSGSGQVQASALLRVIGATLSPPPVIRTGPFDQTLMEGATAVFYCHLVGDEGEVQWTKGEEPIPGTSRFSVDGSHTLRILSIQPSDMATYSCIVTNSSGETSWSASLRIITNNQQPSLVRPPPNPADLPRAPSALSGVNITRNSVHLTWERPPSGGDDEFPVTSYRLEYFTPTTASGWEIAEESIPTTSHLVTGLQSGTPYVFLVRAVNSKGVGAPSRVSRPVLTLGVGDGEGTAFLDSVAVEVTKAVPLSPTAILLQWDVSGLDVALDGFIIKCRPSSGQGNSILKTVMGVSSHIVTGLVPDEDYTVSVQPFHGETEGTESSLEAVRTLPEGRLSPSPTQTSVLEDKLSSCGLEITAAYTVSATKIQLNWSVERHSAYINGYHVTFYPKDRIAQKRIITVTDSRSLTLTDLEPWTSYEIVVRPFNGLYRGEASIPFTGVTGVDVPSIPPRSVQVSLNGSTSLIVSWTPLPKNQVRGTVTAYSVFCLSNNTNAIRNKTVMHPEVFVTRVTELTPSAWYSVSVAAHTSAGMGPPSAPYLIQMPPDTETLPPIGGDEENGLTIKLVAFGSGIVSLFALIILVVFWRKRQDKSAVITKGSLHYEPTSEGVGLTMSAHQSNIQKGSQQPLPPIPTDDMESHHGNNSLLTTFSTTNGTLSSTVGRYWPANTQLNHEQAGPAYWLLEQQDPSYTCQGMQNHATLSSGSSTLSGHRARSPVYAVVDEEDLLTQDPHCSHTLPMHQCTIVSNPAVSTLPPQPYASTQLYPPQNTHFATAPKCSCGSSSNDTGCSSGTSGSHPCPNGTGSKASRAKSKPHRKKRSHQHFQQQPPQSQPQQSQQQQQQCPPNTWSDILPPPPEEPPNDRVPHMQTTPPYNYHTGSSSGSKSSSHHSHPHKQQQQQPQHSHQLPAAVQPVTCHECMQKSQDNMTLPTMHHHHYPPQYPSVHHNQRTYPHVDAYWGGPLGLPQGSRIDPSSGRVFQPISRPTGQYPQEGVHYPQNGVHHPSENGGHNLVPKQVFEDPRHAEIGQELLQYNELMSQSEAPSDNEEGHPMLPRITPGISEQDNRPMQAVSELSDLDAVRGDVDTDFDGSSYCTGSIMASGLSMGGSCGEDEASEGSEEDDRFLNPYPSQHPTNSLPMVTIGNGIQVGSQV